MLKVLRLTNIILIEFAEITFQRGLNVISGETGSGKSAIMHALNQLSGERADSSIIRRGAEKGTIEALFDIDQKPGLINLLHEAGIDHEIGEELLIKREILASGKNRTFINHQPVQVSLLKKVSQNLFEMIGQHANQSLLEVNQHRAIVDAYGDLEQLARSFALSWEQEKEVYHQLEELKSSESKRLREIESTLMEIEELQEANLQEEEEETIFAEYTLLSNSEEQLATIEEVLQILHGDSGKKIQRAQTLLAQVAKIDQSLKETADAFSNAITEIQDAGDVLQRYLGRIEFNPERAAELNERLALINRLKRKYGNSIAEIKAYYADAQQRLKRLENLDQDIVEYETAYSRLQAQTNQLAAELTLKREQAAKHLEQTLVSHLKSLNMPAAEFKVCLTQQSRTSGGDNRVEFYLVPNKGEKSVPVKDCASGGELSRLLLAIKVLLAGKGQISSLVFDEIDSNIGGETASVIGEKLREIGMQHQVLCITHFAQVARKADHHLQISKQEKEGRTLTFVNELNDVSRSQELLRMSGGFA